MRKKFAVDDIIFFKQKVLSWLKQFNTFCFLDSNEYPADKQLIIGAGIKTSYQSVSTNALDGFQQFLEKEEKWLFGHIGYELGVPQRPITSRKADELQFPDLCFFEPQTLLILKNGFLEIEAPNPLTVFNAINNSRILEIELGKKIEIRNSVSQEKYLQIIKKLQEHIYRGDCYEVNFCQEFFAENVLIDPFVLYKKLSAASPNPFSCFYRLEDKWLICASPERFIKKEANRIISQPIKGTLKRTMELLKEEQSILLKSNKDRSENVMIVDLVRNDLSRICNEGSVKVDELFGIYSFPQVHQMISTISGELKADANFKSIIEATFPMGSMTGAPKVRVMQLIDSYEKTKRGIYSGCLGYISPDGDFDFNVVIRSLMYNQTTQYLSFQAGGGITAYSTPEKEWEEALVKVSAIKKILNHYFSEM